ncbi:DNA cytosine methyltransferase [Natrinema sp. H-ect1]|uniref:DNA cytosine methyltransferase n=1 Tax=unclassified Natrinema TaxID=2622230 RepID=UPI00359D3534
MSDRIRVASLFTGAGGLDIGFSTLSEFDVRFHTDIDDIAIDTLRTNAERGSYIDDDAIIERTDITEYDGGDLEPDEVDLVIGGPPCQPFSAAARRSGGFAGADSEDGQLFRAYVKLLERWQPTAFLFENVYGITSDEEDWQMIVDAFENEAGDPGYRLTARTLDAADYGVPQHRARTFIIGVRKDVDEEFRFPRPTHGPDSPADRDLVTAGEALADLETAGAAEDPTYEITSKHAHLLADIPPGLNYSFYTEKLGHPEPVFGWRSRFSDYLYKADPDRPVRTLKAQPGAASGPFHWENRKFTEAELKRLQAFPDDYVLEGSYGQVVKQIGNSVPPRIAEVLAKAIAEELFGADGYDDVVPMPDGYDLNFRSRKRTSTEEYRRKARERLEELGLWDPRNERSGQQRGLEEYGDSSDDETEPEATRRRATLHYRDHFERERLSYGTAVEPDGAGRTFDTESDVDGATLRVDIERQHGGEGTIEIVLEPDDGIWNGIGSLEVTATGVDLDDVFYVWDIAATDVIERTRYEKFIDVVGHYSTTRLDYSSSLELTGVDAGLVPRTLQFFSRASNCNTEFTLDELGRQLNATHEELVDALRQLRGWRYELRTPATHETMPEGKVLCTYPFPDMNERSHFDSEIELDALETRTN